MKFIDLLRYFCVQLFILSISGVKRRNGNLDDVISFLPKIDLHAHLHGSIRLSTLMELSGDPDASLDKRNSLDLDNCFHLFSLLHKAVSTKEALTRIISEVLDDYMEENTIYLELRSTPRRLSDGTTISEYVEILVNLLHQHNEKNGDKMLVKLILSIDRSKSYEEAQQIVNLAIQTPPLSAQITPNNSENNVENSDISALISTNSHENIIVGVDFSGNPLVGRFEDFSPLFTQARAHGLKVTVHMAETHELSTEKHKSTGTDETTAILAFRPDRIGHALHLEQHHIDTLVELHVDGRAPPIEVCPSSNFFTLGLNSHSDHLVLERLLSLYYPISINTDDRGIFKTSMSNELMHVKTSFELTTTDVIQILANSIAQSFASDAEKEALRSKFWTQTNQIVKEFSLDDHFLGNMAALDNNIESLETMLKLLKLQDNEVKSTLTAAEDVVLAM